jgi:hypothetical protein
MTEAPRVPSAVATDDRGVLESPSPQPYVGLATRAIAFALDAALINAVAILTAAVVTVTLSIVAIPDSCARS